MMDVYIPPEFQGLLVPLDSIHQHPRNANNGDIEATAESIVTNGYLAPILIQASTRRIVYGHTRYHAMLSLGQTHIPGYVVQMTDERALRYLVADNRTARLGRDDPATLAAVLLDLADTEIGLIGSGYDETDMMRIVAEAVPEPLTEIEGHGFGVSANDIYQVVVDCRDEDEMREVHAMLLDREIDARMVFG